MQWFRSYSAREVVLATNAWQTQSLLGNHLGRNRTTRNAVQWNRATTFYYAAYYAAGRTPVDGPVLVLNGDGSTAGPVNNAVVVSQCSERYAPPGMHLIAANVAGRAPQSAPQIEMLERDASSQLQRWFGVDVTKWTVLGGYPIAQELPLCTHAEWQQSSLRLREGIYVCGDYLDTPSIQGALASGRRAAQSVLHHFS
jgi:predicted NAD/FAD-dependent oxidoreductase